jgi:subtilisin family serine protease/subtilisin-like proprotein convertase family protein
MFPRRTARRLALEALEDRNLLAAGLAPAAPLLDLSSLDQHHILVQFNTAALSSGTPAGLPGTTVGSVVGLVPGLYEVALAAGVRVDQALAAYRADPRVRLAEPDSLYSASQVPNDPLFGQEWNLQNTGQDGGTPGADVHATKAWDVTQGSRKVVVAVIDTGIDYNHPDLYLNVWINQAEIPPSRRANLIDVDGDGLITFNDLNDPRNQGPFKITDVNHDGRIDGADILAPMIKDASGRDTGMGGWADGISEDGDTAHVDDLLGWNTNDENNNPMDAVGHGTHVAGIIGATGNNGQGVAGIAWNVQLMPVRFLNAQGFGSTAQIIEALDYAVAHGAKIANNSWTGATNDPLLLAAFQRAQAKGQIEVVAAGNLAHNLDTNLDYPSSFGLDNIVSVAATDHNDNLANFSNWGPNTVAIAAPGVNIRSTTPGKSYGLNTGTSMAAPHVTGALALVWGLHPDWTYSQVIGQVLATADRLSSLKGKVRSGRLNVDAAVNSAVIASPLLIVSSSATGPAPNTIGTIRITFNRAIDPTTLDPLDAQLTVSGGAVAPSAVRLVSGSNNRTFDLVFPTQTVPGTYTLRVGPNVRDPNGMSLTAYQATFTIRGPIVVSSTTATPLSKGGTAVSILSVFDDVVLADVNVQINVTHPRVGDLVIHLRAPDGTDVILSYRVGGATANFRNTLLDDEAATPLAKGTAPFTGSFRPSGWLGRLKGKNALGDWQLWIEDRGGKASGTLEGWSLILTPRS